MGTKKSSFASFVAIDVDRRTRRGNFFSDINAIIDWQKVDQQIGKYYSIDRI